MSFLLELPLVRTLHARSLLLPFVVILAVGGVLIQGALNRGDSAEASSEAQQSEPAPQVPTSAFRPDLESTPLSYFTDYWAQLGGHVQGRLLLIGPDAASGVVVSPGVALTSIAAADRLLDRQNAAIESEAPPDGLRLLGVDPDLGVALLEMSQPYSAAAFSPADSTIVKPGSLVAEVSLRPNGRLRVAPGHLRSQYHRDDPVGSFDVSADTPGLRGAAAVVDLDGGLLGVGLENKDGRRLLSTEAVLALLDRMRTAEPCRAIEGGELDADVAELLGIEEGIVIEHVHSGSFLPEPSLRAGDVLIEWNRQAIHGVTHFEVLYDETPEGSLARYVVIRGGSRLRGGTIAPDKRCRPVGEPALRLEKAGMALRWAEADEQTEIPAGWEAIHIRLESPSSAIIALGDRITAAGAAAGRAESRTELEAYERRPRALVLAIARAGRVRLDVLQPPG